MGDAPLDSFIGSITCDVMDDPVSTIDGQTYEQALRATRSWLKRQLVPLHCTMSADELSFQDRTDEFGKGSAFDAKLEDALHANARKAGMCESTHISAIKDKYNRVHNAQQVDQAELQSQNNRHRKKTKAIGDQAQSVQSAQQLSELSTKELNRLCVNHQTGDCVIFKFQGEFSRSPMSLMRDTNYRLLCYNCQEMIWTDLI